MGSSCSICDKASGVISCSSISRGSACKSALLASKQRQRASRKSQNRSFGSDPSAARNAASRNVVCKTSCALLESPSIKKQKRYSCARFCFGTDTLIFFNGRTLRASIASTRDDSKRIVASLCKRTRVAWQHHQCGCESDNVDLNETLSNAVQLPQHFLGC